MTKLFSHFVIPSFVIFRKGEFVTIFWTIVALLIVLGIVVLVHELGHFFAARLFGVTARVFSIGFGPALFKWTDRRGTLWKISVLPLGGYVALYGQEDMFDRKKYHALSADKKHGYYLSVSAWKQAIIIGAGVIMNFVLAWAIYSTMFAVKERQVQLPFIAQVVLDSPAYNAGIRAGDRVEMIGRDKINNWGELLIAKELHTARPADVMVVRGNDVKSFVVQPGEKWGLVADGEKTEMVRKSVPEAIYAGMREVYVQSKTLVVILRQIISGERSSEQLGSFIMIAQVSGKALAAGIFALLSVIALLSVNLAVVNLLPLPVLDGGYLMILGIEGVIRRKLGGRGMEIAIWCGWIFIAFLFILTMWNDIARLTGLPSWSVMRAWIGI